MKVETQLYNKQEPASHGAMDGLFALRMCLEVICYLTSRRPPTVVELFTLLISIDYQRHFTLYEHGRWTVSRALSKEVLWNVLNSYGAPFSEEYKLGIICSTHTAHTYEIEVLGKDSYNQQPKIVWVHNQGAPLGMDEWCAITPDGIKPEAKSFAQIVRQPGFNVQPSNGGNQVTGPPIPVDSNLLSIGSSHASNQLGIPHHCHTGPPSITSCTRSSHRVPTESGRSCFTCQTCGESWDSKSSLT